MKGPSHARQCNVQRVWECPVCQKRVKTAGSVVHLRCEACARNKTGDTAWMRLLEPRRQAHAVFPPAAAPVEPDMQEREGRRNLGEDSDALPTPLNSEKHPPLE